MGGRGGARRGRVREANRKGDRRGREEGGGEGERTREHIILITDDSCTVLLFPQNRKPLH